MPSSSSRDESVGPGMWCVCVGCSNARGRRRAAPVELEELSRLLDRREASSAARARTSVARASRSAAARVAGALGGRRHAAGVASRSTGGGKASRARRARRRRRCPRRARRRAGARRCAAETTAAMATPTPQKDVFRRCARCADASRRPPRRPTLDRRPPRTADGAEASTRRGPARARRAQPRRHRQRPCARPRECRRRPERRAAGVPPTHAARSGARADVTTHRERAPIQWASASAWRSASPRRLRVDASPVGPPVALAAARRRRAAAAAHVRTA